MNKAVIFDWGGVLMRTVDREPRFCWDRQLALPEGTVEKVVHGIDAWDQAQRGEIEIAEYWETVRSELGLMLGLLPKLQSDFYSGDRLDENLLRIIQNLRARRILVGLLSNNTRDLMDTLVAMQIDRLFDALIISAQIGVMKPAATAYYIILEQLRTEPNHALFIDDSEQNVAGALAIGMSAVRFEPGIDLGKYIENWLDEHGGSFAT